MSNITVNEKFLVNGKLSVRRALNEEGKIVVSGSLATHYYFEEIETLRTHRLVLEGIEVYEELYGSDDFDIVYNFVANSLDVINGFTFMNEKEVDVIHKKLYNELGFAKGSNLDFDIKSEGGE